jgi:hypothetical protein
VKEKRKISSDVIFSDSEDEEQGVVRGDSRGGNGGSSSVKSQLSMIDDAGILNDEGDNGGERVGADTIDSSRMSDGETDGKKRGISDKNIHEKKSFLKNKIQRKNDDSDDELFSESPIKKSTGTGAGVNRGRSVLEDSDED